MTTHSDLSRRLSALKEQNAREEANREHYLNRLKESVSKLASMGHTLESDMSDLSALSTEVEGLRDRLSVTYEQKVQQAEEVLSALEAGDVDKANALLQAVPEVRTSHKLEEVPLNSFDFSFDDIDLDFDR